MTVYLSVFAEMIIIFEKCLFAYVALREISQYLL